MYRSVASKTVLHDARGMERKTCLVSFYITSALGEAPASEPLQRTNPTCKMLRAQARASFHALEQRSSFAVAHRVQAAFISSSAGRIPTPRRQNLISTPLSSSSAFPVRLMSTHYGESAIRPEPDKVVQDIADYVHDYKINSDLAWETARLCLIDTIGCGLEGLRFPECQNLLGPVVEGTVVPNGEPAQSPYARSSST